MSRRSFSWGTSLFLKWQTVASGFGGGLFVLVLIAICVVDLFRARASLAQDAAIAPEQVLDRIQYRNSPQDAVRTIYGIVVDVQAKHIEVQNPAGGSRRLPRAEIVSVQLLNQALLAKADQAAAAGKFVEARQGFESVVRTNVPHWMKRYAAARHVQCLRVLEQWRLALSVYVNLVKDDPEQTLIEVLPVVWTSPKVDALLEDQINAWLKSEIESERLVGASLGLLHPPTSASCQTVLNGFIPANDEGKEMSAMEAIARAQLWRLPQNRSLDDLQSMHSELERFPQDAKAGPLLVLGKLWKGAGKPEVAADAFLQIAALYPEQHDLVLLGLEAAYYTLRDLDQNEAKRVGQWLVHRHPTAAQTVDIRKELGL
ncbi:MAG: hypothetical protein JNL67_11875 [Planctomycetaceae bacterium]|nr:hypothetical protein [Planctomycetaceae bacterium]